MSDAGREARNLEIDALRGIAILLVVLAHTGDWRSYRHFGPQRLRDVLFGGVTGVDLFFVISGYVVTGVLVPKIAALESAIGLRATSWSRGVRALLLGFYTRRVFRILPASWTGLACGVVAFAAIDIGLRDVGPARVMYSLECAASAFVFATNYLLYFVSSPGGYDSTPLGHYWSLAIEEQFYLVFPLLLVVVRTRAARIVTFVLLIAGIACVARPLFYDDAAAEHPWSALYLTQFRADGILVGCLLSLVLPPGSGRIVHRGSAIVGSVLLVVALPCVRLLGTFSVVHPLALVLCATLVALAARNERRVLPIGPRGEAFLAWAGSRSYALYLVNWPLLWVVDALWTAVAKAHLPLSLDVIGGALVWLGANLVATELLHRCVERPFLARGRARAARLDHAAHA